MFKLAVSEERERRAIAIELHDRLCQPLAVATMRLSLDGSLPNIASSTARRTTAAG
ncbi:MAG: hypothetical protein R3E68_22230 [Burkholderiaceae bacterium]